MSLEENTEVVDMLAFTNTDQTIMNIRLHGSVIKDTLRERVSTSGVSHTACRDLHLACFVVCD
jgi:hypothetical protein